MGAGLIHCTKKTVQMLHSPFPLDILLMPIFYMRVFSAQRIKELTSDYDNLKKGSIIVFVIYGAQYEVFTSTHCENNYIGD